MFTSDTTKRCQAATPSILRHSFTPRTDLGQLCYLLAHLQVQVPGVFQRQAAVVKHAGRRGGRIFGVARRGAVRRLPACPRRHFSRAGVNPNTTLQVRARWVRCRRPLHSPHGCGGFFFCFVFCGECFGFRRRRWRGERSARGMERGAVPAARSLAHSLTLSPRTRTHPHRSARAARKDERRRRAPDARQPEARARRLDRF